ncbi:hypothetical protein LINGRAHAP2_LOCUS18026 [Linum grandiflorum]
MVESVDLVPTALPNANQTGCPPPISYASAVSRAIVTATPTHNPPIMVKDNEILLSYKNGFRYLHTSGELRAKICEPLKKALAVRLMGKSVGIQYTYDRLKAMWKPEGRMRMVDLDNEVFLVNFDHPQDYDKALTEGPWMILEHYLICHSWDPSFCVSSNLPPKMVVWDGVYENLPSLCFDCGCIGHVAASCPQKAQTSSSTLIPERAPAINDGCRTISTVARDKQPEFVAWLTVQKKIWRSKNKESIKTNLSTTATSGSKKGKDRSGIEKRKELDGIPSDN